MQIKRGDIWYVMSGYSTGSEQRPGRPAVVVSNDKNNEHSSTVEVVYLTTQPKHDLPTHVIINSLSRESIAICEQITTVSTERMENYRGCVSPDEMDALDNAMLVSLGLIQQQSESASEICETPPRWLPNFPKPKRNALCFSRCTIRFWINLFVPTNRQGAASCEASSALRLSVFF